MAYHVKYIEIYPNCGNTHKTKAYRAFVVMQNREIRKYYFTSESELPQYVQAAMHDPNVQTLS